MTLICILWMTPFRQFRINSFFFFFFLGENSLFIVHFVKCILVKYFCGPFMFLHCFSTFCYHSLLIHVFKLKVCFLCLSDIVCPHPHVSRGSRMRGFRSVYKFGNTVTIACAPGLRLIGQNLITCGPDGEWRPKLPECVRRDRRFNWKTHTIQLAVIMS